MTTETEVSAAREKHPPLSAGELTFSVTKVLYEAPTRRYVFMLRGPLEDERDFVPLRRGQMVDFDNGTTANIYEVGEGFVRINDYSFGVKSGATLRDKLPERMVRVSQITLETEPSSSIPLSYNDEVEHDPPPAPTLWTKKDRDGEES